MAIAGNLVATVVAGLEVTTTNAGIGHELRRHRDKKELNFGTGYGASTAI